MMWNTSGNTYSSPFLVNMHATRQQPSGVRLLDIQRPSDTMHQVLESGFHVPEPCWFQSSVTRSTALALGGWYKPPQEVDTI